MDTRTQLVAIEVIVVPKQRFDWVSIRLHWLTVVLVAVQLITAFLPHEGDDARTLLALHRSVGALTLMVVIARLIWRARFAHLPPFPPSMPKLQQRAAKANEWALYAFLLFQPLTGLGDAIFHGRPFVLFGLQVPAVMAMNRPLFHLSGELHEIGAWILMALIAAHVGAALIHGLVLRDGILQRMLPGRISREPAPPP
jgi:superoxide oxidase